MYSQSSKHKPKPKIDPMNMDFDFMIKNHPEFFTKLSTRDHVPEPPSPTKRPPPASGGFSNFSSGWADLRQPDFARGGGGWQVGGAGATLKPKIYLPTLLRNAKPKKGRNNFFK
jgi:hypothetical protein